MADEYKFDASKKPRSMDVALDKIRPDGGTQQRPLNPDAVAEYVERLEANEAPPPLKLIEDAEGNFWLYDGFHRNHARHQHAKATGKNPAEMMVRVAVQKGTQRDAVWLSYAANKDHGVRREPGVVRAIVERVLGDEAYAKLSAKAVAEHVGTSQRYVERVKEEMRSASSAQGGGSKTAPADAGKRTVTRGGQTYEMDVTAMAGPKKAKTTAALPGPLATDDKEPEADEDKVGNKLTNPLHRTVFGRAAELWETYKEINRIKNAAMGAIDLKDELYRYVHVTGTRSDLENAALDFKHAMPYALCPVHPDDATASKDCKWCNGSGWLPKPKYDLAMAALAKGNGNGNGQAADPKSERRGAAPYTSKAGK